MNCPVRRNIFRRNGFRRIIRKPSATGSFLGQKRMVKRFCLITMTNNVKMPKKTFGMIFGWKPLCIAIFKKMAKNPVFSHFYGATPELLELGEIPSCIFNFKLLSTIHNPAHINNSFFKSHFNVSKITHFFAILQNDTFEKLRIENKTSK